MGDLIQITRDEWGVWTGGKPNSGWTERDESSPPSFTCPNQLRPIKIVDAQKSFNHRSEGLKDEFKVGDDLQAFQNRLWVHLEETGMDTIAYVPDPETNEMVNVVLDHARFTVDMVATKIAAQLKCYDEYDQSNDQAARSCLLKTLERSFREDLEEIVEKTYRFPVVWLYLVRRLQSTLSVQRFDDIKDQIKACMPSKFPGQNLSLMVSELRRHAKILKSAGQYDHNLTLIMLKNFIKAGGDSTAADNFRYNLRDVRRRLEEVLTSI